MAITFQKQTIKGSFPKIWRGEAKVLPGGFALGQNLPVGTFIDRATLLHVDFAERKAYIVKVAEVLEGSTTTKVRVKKGNHFQVGDKIAKLGEGTKSPAISAIDASNETYDVLTIQAITGLAAGDIVVESTDYVAAEGTEGQEGYKPAVLAQPKYLPDAVVAAKKQLDGKGIPVVDAAYEAVVLYPAVPYAIPAEWLEGFSLKNNHSIKFIKQ